MTSQVPGPDGPPIGEDEAEELLRCICFKTGPPGTVGVEVELIVHDARSARRNVVPYHLWAAFGKARALPLNSPLTIEPGGQVELSSPPASSLMSCVDQVTADLRAVRREFAAHRLVLSGYGVDPWSPPRRRAVRDRRFDALQVYFGRTGPSGLAMMCDSASVQVCLDAGHDGPGPLGFRERWRTAHLLGAVLVAAFANSPCYEGRRTGWRSTRQLIWTELDAVRTLAPTDAGDPRDAWARHVLDSPVLCVRTPEGPWDVPHDLTFRQWIRTGAPRPPTAQDLEYHRTTLFPPVRPRGHLEFRMIDAQPGEQGWIVPLAVCTALFDDPEAAEAVQRVVAPLAERAGPLPAPRNPLWIDAARHGVRDPELHGAALAAFGIALEALPRVGASPSVVDAVAAFHDQYVAKGRCPADDVELAFTGKDART
ncbi:ergothioneine biosynthesis glutamate--cysteine ligase EgtA [Streptomyces sp. NPDC001941]|uniref:ergothioneine biosynthesis glutamate--cysteine ligase EgtA n=1 Tax=Streptomyces sp. NPDC001941 TaxID=3154659 RepID=UPI00332644A0